MSDQFSRAKRRKILDKVSDTIDKWDDANAKIIEARERAEKAEREVERLSKIVIECDGIECVKHDGLVRIAVKERQEAEERAARYGKALEFYANTDNWDETEDPVITSRDPLGSTPKFHIVFLGQDERWPGHPSSAAIETLEPSKKGEAHDR